MAHAKLQDLYILADETLRKAQEDLRLLEKEARRISPYFENLESRLETLAKALPEERFPRLARRLSQLRFHFRRLAYRHSYASELFDALERALHIARRRMPHEIIPPVLLQRLKPRVFPVAPTAKPSEKKLRDHILFYRIRHGSMYFLIPARKLAFRAVVPRREKLTIEIRKGDFRGRHQFQLLPGEDPLDELSKQKQAFLFLQDKGKTLAVLADEILGKAYLKAHLLRRMVNYLKIASDWYEAFVVLEGKRYYILRPWLDKLPIHLPHG
ncbi:MAG: hypothetical protein NZM25_00115 [Leptospiraceae bacterium]|nr:hypothetical protein [Leptospiraceae bacterium]MDW8307555.1 hypothetical protein [Leptospiraceae bacterium]